MEARLENRQYLYFCAKTSPSFPVRPTPGFFLKGQHNGVFNLLLGVAFGEKLANFLHGDFEILPLVWLGLGSGSESGSLFVSCLDAAFSSFATAFKTALLLRIANGDGEHRTGCSLQREV